MIIKSANSVTAPQIIIEMIPHFHFPRLYQGICATLLCIDGGWDSAAAPVPNKNDVSDEVIVFWRSTLISQTYFRTLLNWISAMLCEVACTERIVKLEDTDAHPHKSSLPGLHSAFNLYWREILDLTQHKGPVNIAIIGGTHGNELTGISLINRWMTNPAPLSRPSLPPVYTVSLDSVSFI